MVDTLPPISDGTCISGIAIDMSDVMLSIADELVHCALSAHAEHMVGARGPVWKLR